MELVTLGEGDVGEIDIQSPDKVITLDDKSDDRNSIRSWKRISSVTNNPPKKGSTIMQSPFC